MNVGSVFATLTAKTDDFNKKIRGASDSLEKFGSAGKRLEDQMKSLEMRKESLKTKLNNLNSSIEKTTATSGYLNKKLTEWQAKNDKLVQAKDKLIRQLDIEANKNGEASTKYKNLEKQIDGYSKKIAESGGKIATLSGQIIRNNDSLERQKQGFKNVSDQMANVNNRIDTQKMKMGEFADTSSAKVKKLQDSFSQLTQTKINQFAEGVGSAFATVGKYVATAGVSIGAFAGVIGGLAIKTTGDFQTQMLRTKAVARSTEEEFKAMKEQAIDLGAKTMFSAKQVAEAQFFLAAAGLKTDQILKATNATLSLAAAGQIELGRSAEITSNILAQFQMPAEQVERAVDVMALAVNMSTQNMEELADAMNYLGPTAKAMGVSFEEATAITIEMSNAGLKGSLGTRALGTSIVKLTNPTEKMANTMEELGLKFFDAKGNFIGIAGTLKQLEKGFQGLTQEQRMAALSTIFGNEAIQEWSILMQNGSGTLENFTSELGKAKGSAGEMAKTMQSGWAGATERMSSAWDGFLIRIGDSGLLDIATSGINYITAQMDRLANSQAFQDFITNFKNGLAELKTNLQPVKEAIANLPETLQKISDWYNNNSSWLIPLAEFLGGVALGFGLIATSIWLVNTAMIVFAIVTSPIFLIALLVAGLIGLIVLLVLNWDTLKAAAIRTWEGIKQAIRDAVSNIQIWFNDLVQKIQEKWKEIWDKAVEIWNNITTSISNAINDAKNNIVNTLNSINLYEIGKNIIQGLINGITSMAGSVASKAQEIANNITNTIKGALNIHSPSRVMMEMGRNVGEGMAIGMDQSQVQVAQSSANMAGATIGGAMTSTVNQTNSFNIQGGNNTQAIVSEVMRVLSRQNNLANAGIGI